jgi:hypothetical protein
MKVGLIDIEPKVVNSAYMQIAGYYRSQGHEVGWWSPLTDRQFDHVFCSSLFDFTPKYEVPTRAICGGTGYDLTSKLSRDIEAADYDYSLYPECDYSIVWFSRGCIRNCPFCVVHKKEGNIRPVKPKNLNPNGKYIVVQDNNFFANPDWKQAAEQIEQWGQPLNFQGIDVRILSVGQAQWLATLRHYKQIKIAWDNPKECIDVCIESLLDFIPAYKLMCYVLVGYNSSEEQDLYRVERLRELSVDPFVMPFNKTHPYQRRFARWVNHKAIFKSVKWKDYKAPAV